MAYIKERGNNNYFVRVSCGIRFLFVRVGNHTQYHTNTGKSRKQTDNNQILLFRSLESSTVSSTPSLF